MEEIIFRGKRKDTSEWIEGFYASQSNHACFQSELKYTIFILKDEFMDWGLGGLAEYEVFPETVSQFTGLVDKHGKKIFEGDILAKGFELYEVRWNPEQVRWGIYSDNYEVAGFTKFSETYFEVVGNIYDNKELLGVIRK